VFSMTNDTRNNWVTMMFKCKYAYNCLRKQTIIDDCEQAFRCHEKLGFEFKEIGFGGNHVHFSVDVPKKYSLLVAQIMLKSHSSRMLFKKHPNLRKRYPKGEFWSGYEHHQSTGVINLDDSNRYIRSQREHHQVHVIDDRQKKLGIFTAKQDTACPQG
jgi:putative transposase